MDGGMLLEFSRVCGSEHVARMKCNTEECEKPTTRRKPVEKESESFFRYLQKSLLLNYFNRFCIILADSSCRQMEVWKVEIFKIDLQLSFF